MENINVKEKVNFMEETFGNLVRAVEVFSENFYLKWLYEGARSFLCEENEYSRGRRRECLTLFFLFSNVLRDCERLEITQEDLPSEFNLDIMSRFVESYESWTLSQLSDPSLIL